jgi:hypothetical protein
MTKHLLAYAHVLFVHVLTSYVPDRAAWHRRPCSTVPFVFLTRCTCVDWSPSVHMLLQCVLLQRLTAAPQSVRGTGGLERLETHPSTRTPALALRVARLGVGSLERAGRQRAAGGAAPAPPALAGSDPELPEYDWDHSTAMTLAVNGLERACMLMSARAPTPARDARWVEAWGLLLRWLHALLERGDVAEVRDSVAPLLDSYIQALPGAPRPSCLATT